MTPDSFNDQIIEINSDLEKAYKQWENIVIPEKHIRKIHLEIDELALKYGWVWDFGHTTPAEIDDLLQEWSIIESKDKQERIISDYFVNYYSSWNFSRLEEFISNWANNAIFQKRILILRDCLVALQNASESFNPSNLVVPVLILQIDGIIAELLEREGWHFVEKKEGNKEKSWINLNAHTRKNPEKKSEKCFANLMENKRIRSGSTDFGKLIHMNSRYDALKNGLFQTAFHGDPVKNQFFPSRNKILHGEDIEYGTIKNVIKLFLILNFLSEFTTSNIVDPDDHLLVEYRKPSSLYKEKKKLVGSWWPHHLD
jgi:hypothetical protein